ncbi:uncharacterized protein [Rhodnius prolixus]|uniref:uncharacterized protein n=1 Tax=Rhodnius prolixus TaxID=13249 RepID=UPI003D18DBA2
MMKSILSTIYFVHFLNIYATEMFTSAQLSQIISYHFNDFGGAHLYFCTARAAKSIFKRITEGNNVYNVKSLDRSLKNKNIEVNFQQPQVQGIYLDLTCNHGVAFLHQSSKMFNSSYRWLLWSDNYKNTVDLLTPMRVLADSDVTIAIYEEHGVILADIYRIHESQPFRITNFTQWSDSKLIHLDVPLPRDNFESIELAASLMLSFTIYINI